LTAQETETGGTFIRIKPGGNIMADKYAKGHYSIIRYVHEHEKGEPINIVILLFCPEPYFFDTIISQNQNRRVETERD
jgi:hypothetical protein